MIKSTSQCSKHRCLASNQRFDKTASQASVISDTSRLEQQLATFFGLGAKKTQNLDL